MGLKKIINKMRFGNTTGYSKFENDGTLVFNGDAKVWDDLQVSVSQARTPPSSAPTWRTFDFNIDSGIEFPVLGFAVDDYFDLFIQTQHAQKLNSDIDFHVHFTTPTDSADDRFKFQVDVVAAGIGSDFAVPSGSPYSSEHILDGTESGKHNYFDIAEITAFNDTVSSVAILRVTRVAASVDEYSGEVYLVYADCHFQKDTVGSRQEVVK